MRRNNSHLRFIFHISRMPLSYVHFVNMLVSTLILLSPVALFPVLYYWSIPAVGILALFYKGVFRLDLQNAPSVGSHYLRTSELYSLIFIAPPRMPTAALLRHPHSLAHVPRSCRQRFVPFKVCGKCWV